MAAGLEHRQHAVVADHGRDRVDATRQRFAEDDEIGAHLLVLRAQQLAGAAEPRLDLVADQETVVLVTQIAQLLQVAARRHDDTGLALDRLDQQRHDVLAHRLLDGLEIAVGHAAKAGVNGPKSCL